LGDGHEVVCLDNFDIYYDPRIKRANIAHLATDPNFTLIEGDVRDKKLLKEILEGVDYVFHEAAQAGVRASIQDPFKPHEMNATGTLALLRASVDANVKKMIYASSSSVYGKVKYLPFDEDHPNQPISPYGVSKLMAEHYCRVFSEVYGLKTISLRYFTVYGPRMRPDLAINIFTRDASNNELINIFGNGSKTRDFTYIDDIIEANMIAMRKGEGVYNIGGGNRISITELAERIISIIGSASRIAYKDSEKGDAEHTLANIDRAKRELGWSPRITIEEGLRRYVEWTRNYQ
jgi:UDP-glucose 4-epimerase